MQKKIEAQKIENVREQYEKYPYPAIPWIATPGRNDTKTLQPPIPLARRPRILIAGCGTFEPVVFAKAFPRARITAVDISRAALKRCFLRGLVARRFIRTVHADLHDDLSVRLGVFDYVVCTGVLHHTPAPELMLAQLAKLVRPDGVLRLMVYADESRHLVREVQKFFQKNNLSAKTEGLYQKCHALIKTLKPEDPLRTSFEHYTDSRNAAGLIDGFFHACENRLSIPTLKSLCDENKLKFLGTANEDLQIKSWEQLAQTDAAREMNVNPVLWLAK